MHVCLFGMPMSWFDGMLVCLRACACARAFACAYACMHAYVVLCFLHVVMSARMYAFGYVRNYVSIIG